MKNTIFLLLFLLVFAAVAGAQTGHQFLDDRSILNYNYNWGKVYMDTLCCRPGVASTLVLSGQQGGFNLIVQSMDGDIELKLDSSWPLWWRVYDGSFLSVSGGKLDTLFFRSVEADSSVVQIMWTSFK